MHVVPGFLRGGIPGTKDVPFHSSILCDPGQALETKAARLRPASTAETIVIARPLVPVMWIAEEDIYLLGGISFGTSGRRHDDRDSHGQIISI